ncbi:MAG TPA: YXWGXW repeat-containing protein [Candidatus Didemnitutus sp.]|nr:YXWGXW repeat-containing protein [Candidatus Didemnitutus sp.]
MNTSWTEFIGKRRVACLCGLGMGLMSLAAPRMVSATLPIPALPIPNLVGEVGVGINIDVAPPPPREEVIDEHMRPSPDHVWINGYWAWRGGHHEWVRGHWERPPHAHARWVEPRWERHGGHYTFVEGYWR